jgi:hypothetical protein
VSKRRPESKRFRINPDNLAPLVAEGLSQGNEPVPERDRVLSGVEAIRYMREGARVNRVPVARFVGETAPSDLPVQMLTEMPDGRVFVDPVNTFQPETMDAMRAGMICMECHEPQVQPFEDSHLPGCLGVETYGPHFMRDHQGLRLATETVADRHIGPSKPMSELLEEQDERAEKARASRKLLEGGSRMKGLRASQN